jgi:hypothetical protein
MSSLIKGTLLRCLIKTLFLRFRYHFRFRRGFKQFFQCCPFVHLGPEVLTRREVVTSRYSCSGSPDHHRIVRNGKSTRKRSFNYADWSFNRIVSYFLPFCPQIRNALSSIPVRGRQKVIVNLMVSIIASMTLKIVCFFLLLVFFLIGKLFLLWRQKVFNDLIFHLFALHVSLKLRTFPIFWLQKVFFSIVWVVSF